MTLPIVPETKEVKPYAALENPAVVHCQDVWQRVYQSDLKSRKRAEIANMNADRAYHRAMPSLSGYQNICDFIACIGYAMLMGIIRDDRATRLLYAAQLALSSVPRPSKTPDRAAAYVRPGTYLTF
jgi:hypothetical protein